MPRLEARRVSLLLGLCAAPYFVSSPAAPPCSFSLSSLFLFLSLFHGCPNTLRDLSLDFLKMGWSSEISSRWQSHPQKVAVHHCQSILWHSSSRPVCHNLHCHILLNVSFYKTVHPSCHLTFSQKRHWIGGTKRCRRAGTTCSK